MKSTSNNSAKQGGPRFAMIPEAVLCSSEFRGLSGAKLRIYMALALHADKSRECYPKMETLAEIAGVDLRTAEKIIPEIVELGLVVKQSGGGRGRSNRYRLVDNPGGENPGQLAGVSSVVNPGEAAGLSSENPGQIASKPRPSDRGNIQEQTCHGDEGSARVFALRSALSDAGVQGPNLDRLAGLDDLTVQDVESLFAVANEKAARNPAGLLVSMIIASQRPASQPGSTPNVTNDFTRPSSREEAADLFPSIPQ